MLLEIHLKLGLKEPDFPERIFLAQKLGKWTKNRSKTGIFKYIEEFCH